MSARTRSCAADHSDLCLAANQVVESNEKTLVNEIENNNPNENDSELNFIMLLSNNETNIDDYFRPPQENNPNNILGINTGCSALKNHDKLSRAVEGPYGIFS